MTRLAGKAVTATGARQDTRLSLTGPTGSGVTLPLVRSSAVHHSHLLTIISPPLLEALMRKLNT